MIGKLPVLAFSLVTALSGSALAHEDRHTSYGHSGPASYGGYAPPGHHVEYSGRAEVDLRYADLNRDGWVTLGEALDSGRQVFWRVDRDNDRVLSRYEMGRRGARRGDRNGDGRVTMREYQRSLRARFASLDSNGDGVLARYELGLEPRRGTRSAGWWR